MITGELKNRIDSLWDIFASGGLVNPLEVIEQITYLMFIHDLDDADNIRAKESAMLELPYKSIFSDEIKIGERCIAGSQLKWSVFHDFPADRMYSVVQEWVFPFIKTLHSNKNSAYSKYMDDAIFKLPTPLVLSKVVDSLDEIYRIMNEMQTADVRGDVYEYLLSKIAQSGRNGQFRTPRHIIRMMVEMMDPSSDEVICDPACGTSGFLVAAGEYLKEKKKKEIFFDRQKKAHYMNHMFHGYDMDRTMLRIGAMNMMTHGIDNPFIEYRDSLSDQNPDKEKYSLVLANPPFKGSLDAESVSGDLLKVCKTKKTELLFLALFLRMLKIGGRCACIVPDGVLFGSSKAHKGIRKEIVENQRLEAVISMPSGVFKPYAGVSTAILIFTKTAHGGTDKVWFYDMKADGFSLDDKRNPVDENDIPDIIQRFRNPDGETERKRTDQSFFVDKNDIVENEYDLSINKYKEVEYVPVEYPSTQEIMASLHELEAEITKNLAELEEMLKDEKTPPTSH
ncbi:MAG: class I SAM-dependent DNA methyltransferase [Eubacteriales bacterium]|nr:class I SAM-dependent DNA methyltransferase [Eubacteriales bacterium]